jgi:RNA polymerase sigma factor (sigma-70 family)
LKSWIELALPGAVAYASSLMGDRGRGEDIVQDCICRLLGHAARYDLERDGRKLLFRAVTNACINQHTRGHKTVSLDRHGRQPDGGAWQVMDPGAPTPTAVAMANELRQAIADGLHALPLRQRSALELSSLGYDPHEIGEMLEVKYERVRVILFRA